MASWNEKLEDWARTDKGIYELLQEVKKTDRIIKDLKKADILHLSKERLRIQKSPIVSSKKEEISSLPTRIKETLSKATDYNIISNKEEVSANKLPIEINPEKQTVIIYEKHKDFIEELRMQRKKYRVSYDDWDPDRDVFSICRLLNKDENEVVFNRNHPLFKSKLSDEIVKKLSLGVVVISKDRKDEKTLVRKLNRLIEDAFLV